MFQAEIIPDYKCENCGGAKGKLKRKQVMTHVPNVMILFFNRNYYDFAEKDHRINRTPIAIKKKMKVKNENYQLRSIIITKEQIKWFSDILFVIA